MVFVSCTLRRKWKYNSCKKASVSYCFQIPRGMWNDVPVILYEGCSKGIAHSRGNLDTTW